MKTSEYRLDEYRISENADGGLWWQAHHGFGGYREGRCFRKREILFLGPAESEGIGFLKGEFLDSLKHLPHWSATRYYCAGFKVFSCATGSLASEQVMRRWQEEAGGGEVVKGQPPARESRSFRLGRQEIVWNSDHSISWRSYGQRGAMRTGGGFILDDILFLEPFSSEQQGVSKGEFLARLTSLPGWEVTTYYSHNIEVQECSPGGQLPLGAPQGPTGALLKAEWGKGIAVKALKGSVHIAGQALRGLLTMSLLAAQGVRVVAQELASHLGALAQQALIWNKKKLKSCWRRGRRRP